MSPFIDTTWFQLGAPPDDDPEEEGPLLDALTEDARAFVQSFRWAPPITDLLLAFGIGGVLGLFLVRFEREIAGHGDRELWIVVGDMPSIYFETDDARTPARALQLYCAIAQDWADNVMAGQDLSESYPIPVAPTVEHAEMLLSRIKHIREVFVPVAEERCSGS